MNWIKIDRDSNGIASDKTIEIVRNSIPVIVLFDSPKKNKPRYKVIDQREYLNESRLHYIKHNKEFTHFMPFTEPLNEDEPISILSIMRLRNEMTSIIDHLFTIYVKTH